MHHKAVLLMTEFVTHDVKRFLLSKPAGLIHHPGQGVELSIDKPGWREKSRPFTPTSLLQDRILEFIIKRYDDHHGVTEQLHRLVPGDELLLSDAFGTITYHGPGTFIAAGAGVTPFIALMRNVAQRGSLEAQRLIFSNKTPADVICEKEFRFYFKERCILTCTRESFPGYDNRRIDRGFLQEKIPDFSGRFYVCGPKQFVKTINGTLQELGASPDSLVFEQ